MIHLKWIAWSITLGKVSKDYGSQVVNRMIDGHGTKVQTEHGHGAQHGARVRGTGTKVNPKKSEGKFLIQYPTPNFKSTFFLSRRHADPPITRTLLLSKYYYLCTYLKILRYGYQFKIRW